MIRQAREMKEGDGADVRRLFPLWGGFMNYDPFVLWDHFSVGANAGFPAHPHRGFEAITYLFEGRMRHEDNLGNASTVLPGGAQRFTAGKGIVHSEMPGSEGNSVGIQLWINLPKRLKTVEPDYQQVNAEGIPTQKIDKGTLRVIVGKESPLQLKTPVRYLEIQLEAGGQFSDIIENNFRGFIYLVEGAVEIDGQALTIGDAWFSENPRELMVKATGASRFMVCFGKPHGEPIHQHGPYVD